MKGYELRGGPYSAVVTERGAALRQLRHGERDLIVPFPAGGPIPDYRGILAAPWPNRIEDGKYSLDGVEHQLAVNEPERSCALHGLVYGRNWTVEEQDRSSLVLACSLGPVPGYPFTLRLTAWYHLDDDGLHTSVLAANTGTGAAPYGVCPHPYLLAGPAPLDEWTLDFPASHYLDVTPDRLLPVGLRTVDNHVFDFREPSTIGATEIDHAFTGIGFDAAGRAQLHVRDPGGTGVGMEWDRACPWLQIHTADKPTPENTRLGLAVEPMTCPPNAFNSGQDLARLEAGATHEASWRIFAL
ncbi:aldose 1-epimerase family protein [Arthrobacter sp. HMWF013]|uniref:aldose 1-epimerase family protein n=1 Tax=Arthrobacter sp. HMWF013 TaxID=2056849 RepID=UPI000D349E8E|nr:aldose 1-epimerase family protein [Arthrobacter sp. HMWF013]PTT59133.1 galactose mutarotase [Arthrobacter sp. HMWF013]